MRSVPALLVICLFVVAAAAHAESGPLDCARKSLSDAIAGVKGENQTIVFTGVCAGPVVIRVDGLTLVGVGGAVIDGGGSDAVTIEGASRVSLVDVEIRNGLNGVIAADGAHIALTRVNAHDNTMSGIVVQASSSLIGSSVTATQNGRIGLAGDDGAAITLADATLTANTQKDLLLTFGSRADFRTTVFGTYACDATVLVRGTAGIVCPH